MEAEAEKEMKTKFKKEKGNKSKISLIRQCFPNSPGGSQTIRRRENVTPKRKNEKSACSHFDWPSKRRKFSDNLKMWRDLDNRSHSEGYSLVFSVQWVGSGRRLTSLV